MNLTAGYGRGPLTFSLFVVIVGKIILGSAITLFFYSTNLSLLLLEVTAWPTA